MLSVSSRGRRVQALRAGRAGKLWQSGRERAGFECPARRRAGAVADHCPGRRRRAAAPWRAPGPGQHRGQRPAPARPPTARSQAPRPGLVNVSGGCCLDLTRNTLWTWGLALCVSFPEGRSRQVDEQIDVFIYSWCWLAFSQWRNSSFILWGKTGQRDNTRAWSGTGMVEWI